MPVVATVGVRTHVTQQGLRWRCRMDLQFPGRGAQSRVTSVRREFGPGIAVEYPHAPSLSAKPQKHSPKFMKANLLPALNRFSLTDAVLGKHGRTRSNFLSKTRAVALVVGLLEACPLFGQGFFPVVETATNFWGVGNIMLMTETSPEGMNLYAGDSWDVTVWFSAGVVSSSVAVATVGPFSFEHHAAGFEPSAISVPAQPSITFNAFTEPQWFEFSGSGPVPGDSLSGIPDFVYRVSGTVAYDGRTWFSWYPTVELQVIPEPRTFALAGLGVAVLMIARRRE